MRDVIILRTALLYEADMLAEALNEAQIPHYQQRVNFAGVREAMLPFPVQGPGQFFHVLVPEAGVPDAKEILDSLPIEQHNHPGLWSFNPKPWARRFIVISVAIYLGFLALLYGIPLVSHFLKAILYRF